MKCDLCGTESQFDATFVSERKAFRSSRRSVCSSCWIQRINARHSGFLLAIVVAGIVGYAMNWVAPDALVGVLLRNFFFIGLFLILSIVPHELGHAMVARALGWRVYQIVIGVGKPLFKRRWFGVLFDIRTIPVAGATWMLPKEMAWFRTKLFLAVLAGPAVNIAMAMAVIVVWQGRLSHFDWDALPNAARLFLLANFWVALANLWPHESKTGFALASDGKQLLQLLSFRKSALEKIEARRFLMKAIMQREEGDMVAARRCCEEGLAQFPENPFLLNLSGINHLDEQNYAKAREVFLKLAEKENQPAGVRLQFLNNLAYADALSENPAWLSEADAYSLDVYRSVPWMPEVVGTRGTVLLALGHYEEGMALLKKAMDDAHHPRQKAENTCHLAVALARTGKGDDARKYLELAKQLDPTCPLLTRVERTIDSAAAPAESQTLSPTALDGC